MSRRRGTAEANGRNANPARGYENTHRTHELHHRPGRRRSGEEIGKATRVAPGRTVGGLAATDESNALAGVECANGLIDYRSRSITAEQAKRRVEGNRPAVERGPVGRCFGPAFCDAASAALCGAVRRQRSPVRRVAHALPPVRESGWGGPFSGAHLDSLDAHHLGHASPSRARGAQPLPAALLRPGDRAGAVALADAPLVVALDPFTGHNAGLVSVLWVK